MGRTRVEAGQREADQADDGEPDRQGADALDQRQQGQDQERDAGGGQRAAGQRRTDRQQHGEDEQRKADFLVEQQIVGARHERDRDDRRSGQRAGDERVRKRAGDCL